MTVLLYLVSSCWARRRGSDHLHCSAGAADSRLRRPTGLDIMSLSRETFAAGVEAYNLRKPWLGMDDLLLEGPPEAPELVCLIHGWPDDLHLWDKLVADLLETGKYRCLRVTMPGFGHRMGKLVDGRSIPVSAPNFHEVAQLIAKVIEAKRQGTEQASLIVHGALLLDFMLA